MRRQRNLVQVLAHASSSSLNSIELLRLCHADPLGEAAEASGGVAAPARPTSVGMRGSSQPSTCLPRPAGSAFASKHDVGQVEARELELLRQRRCEPSAGLGERSLNQS
jgi:hypothetical protein